MRYLNSVYIRDHRARIGHRRGSLVVKQPSVTTRIPLAGIDSVILLGAGQVSSEALAACAKRGIRVASLRRNGAVRFVVGGPVSGNVHLRMSQYAAVLDERQTLAIAGAIVAAKLQSSRRMLLRWSRESKSPADRERLNRRACMIAERISRVAAAESGDYLRGLEGDAARIYFRGLAQHLEDVDLRFNLRTRRPPRDPVNSLLSFAYGLLTAELEGSINAVGLDHQLGFLHRPRAGRSSLALDLAEELRPLTDRFAVAMLKRRQVRPAHFVRTAGGAVYLADEGRDSVLESWEAHKETQFPHRILRRPVERWALPAVQATLLARHLRGDLPMYPPFVVP
ncbi:MAG: CRISPR-associated endonuclease Cas1 [Acidimicrobiaceae bacterium]|nr:CRISPR-associated endonuclease Cas1 [Acidimicrobiaceae bacterium]